MTLGRTSEYAGRWFRLGKTGKEQRERFFARYPTVDEKFAHSELEPSWFTGGDKPGSERIFQPARHMQDTLKFTLPLLTGHEVEGGKRNDGDWTRKQLAAEGGGAYVEEVVALGAYLFRPTSDASDSEPERNQGPSGVSEDAGSREAAGTENLSRLSGSMPGA